MCEERSILSDNVPMGPSQTLALLYRRRVVVRRYGQSLRVRNWNGRSLSKQTLELVRANKPEILRLLVFVAAYRGHLQRMFRRSVRGCDQSEVQTFLDRQALLVDNLGPELARQVFLDAGRAYRVRTAICPWCTEDGGTCLEPKE